jgi:predicted Zn-dependent protease
MSRVFYFLLAGTLIYAMAAASQQISSLAPSASSDISPAVPFAEATRLTEVGKFDEALSLLQGFAERNPDYKGMSHALGIAYYKKGDHMKAIEFLKKAVAEDATDNEAVQLLGLSYYLSGRPAEAIPLLVRVQSWYPVTNVDASYMLGLSYIQTKDYDDARKAFAAMYGVPPDSAASHLFLARMLLRQGFDPIAEAEGKKAIELDPHLPLAHYLLGELYIFKSRIPEAIQELEAEMKINPSNAANYYRLADAYTRVMRWEDAERLLQRSVWLDATASGPYILMGKVLLKKNEPNLAARSLERAVSMDPNNYMGHYLLGQAYTALGRPDDGRREVQLSEKLQASQNRSQAELR